MATLKRPEIGYDDLLSLNAGQKYCRILSTFIKLPFVIKIFVLSIFEWLFYTAFTILYYENTWQDYVQDKTNFEHKMKKVNKQCLLYTPRTVRVSEKTWQVIVRTRRP